MYQRNVALPDMVETIRRVLVRLGLRVIYREYRVREQGQARSYVRTIEKKKEKKKQKEKVKREEKEKNEKKGKKKKGKKKERGKKGRGRGSRSKEASNRKLHSVSPSQT
ncbi:hypothetical protein LTR91_026217 [Friedmanniomyces endolithicus]|uniref:Uncharacterized protein n=1 Tax=Friedmanniomyces endolithicus TaxID=329885 RepID=A0AAN6GYR7_9PEZI|nr:hypothetical protein LTR91_026217 [Friedmanniomyces endolithicus]